MTNETSHLEKNVIAAAAALAEAQIKNIRARARQAEVEADKSRLEDELEVAELELAEADLAFATTRVALLKALKAKKERIPCDDCNAVNARVELWAVAASGDPEAILLAARKYGEKAHAYFVDAREREALETSIADLREKLKSAGEERTAAVRKRGKLRAAIKALATELGELYGATVESIGFFDLEKALADAAHELTGTMDERFAYSYVYTPDLPITLPEEVVSSQSPSQAGAH
ncbi:MAG: hypothetical protein KC777_05465 [Cyanobacteria bacterium HKST-UBA02]|nr:hypothetical protein [Cyanobacteria bacterium HKST-UBA02]